MALSSLYNSNEEFRELAQDLEADLGDLNYHKSQVDQILQVIQSGQRATNDELRHYKKCMSTLNKAVPDFNDKLDKLKSLASENKQHRICDKLALQFKRCQEAIEDSNETYRQLTSVNKELDRRFDNVGEDSKITSFSSNNEGKQSLMSDVAVMKVFDQKKVIEGRNEHIQNIRTRAQQVNQLAEGIYTKIEDQGAKLDMLNKDMGKAQSMLKEGQENMQEVAERGAKRTRCLLKCLALATVLVAALILWLLLQFGFFRGGGGSGGSGSPSGSGSGSLPNPSPSNTTIGLGYGRRLNLGFRL